MARQQQQTAGILLFLILSSRMIAFKVHAAGATASTGSSFPAPLPEHNLKSSSRRSNNFTDGAGGASSDDEGTDEDGMSSSEEFEDHPEEEESALSWFPRYGRHASGDEELNDKEAQDVDSNSIEVKRPLSPNAEKSSKPQQQQTNGNRKEPKARTSPGESKSSHTDEDSPPLQTIHKLRRMLDDTDYMTSKLSPMNREAQPERGPAKATNRPTDNTPTSDDSLPQKSLIEGSLEKQSGNLTPQRPSEEKVTGSTSTSGEEQSSSTSMENSADSDDRLWTSKDRSKYKKVQNRWRRASPPIFLTSDDEASDNEDGLGYVLPNIPVYYSDGEESDEAESDNGEVAEENISNVHPEAKSPTTASAPRSRDAPLEPAKQTPPSDPTGAREVGAAPLSGSNGVITPIQQGYVPPMYIPPGNMYPYQGSHPSGQQQQQQTLQRPFNPYLYGYPYPPYQQQQPYGPYLPSHQQQYPYPNTYQQNQQWNAGDYQRPPQYQQQGNLITPWGQAQPPTRPVPTKVLDPTTSTNQPSASTAARADPSRTAGMQIRSVPYTPQATGLDMRSMSFAPTITDGPSSLAEASSKISFDSIQKISLMLVTMALACYAGVSPRTLPLEAYNLKFYENFRLVSLAMISPVVKLLSIFDARHNDVNDIVNSFFASFTLGYPLAFALEVVATTLVRLAVFAWFEPRIFSLAPKVPIPVIPWTLRENQYRPKRITLLAADFCASCVASPFIEEYVKLKTLEWTTNLRKNFRLAKKNVSSKKSKKRRRWVAEPLPRRPGETDVTTANQFVTQMMAVSIGMKLCDAGRRILMYTKASDADKSFYAFCRGLFPIHELCGTMTAIGLARRDLLGVDLPVWKLLFPAVLIHGMANMRGKKPIFRWGSATPWSEMQLSPLHILDSSTLPKLLSKGFAKLMWVVLLSRVLGYCIKNYYLVNRHALKRTTRYANNHAAFSAELATAELLKKK